MLRTKLKVATVVVLMVSLLGVGGLLSDHAFATEPAHAKRTTRPQETTARRSTAVSEDVQQVLDKHRAARPDVKDLAIFQLDWTLTLKEAKARAAKEKRPILLIVVTNSFGNMYTGHC